MKLAAVHDEHSPPKKKILKVWLDYSETLWICEQTQNIVTLKEYQLFFGH